MRGRWKRSTIARASTVVALAALGLSGCRKEAAPPKPAPKPPVVVAPVTVGDVVVTRDYPGTLVSVRTVEITARVEGWLLEQAFKDGALVTPGEVLYRIDPAPFRVALDQARADLAVAEAQWANAHQQYERNKPLVAVEAVSAEAFETLEANDRAAAANVLAKRAAVEQAELNLSYCTITSPLAGQISKTLVYEGTLVGPGMADKLNNIRQLDPVWAQFSPVAGDLPALRSIMHSGDAAIVVSLPGTAWTKSGRIVFIDNEVGSTTSTIAVRVELPNADTAVLPGAYVSVRIPISTLTAAVSVPEEAIVYQTAQALVWVLKDDGTVDDVPIETGPRGGAGIVVTKGLSPGQRVVVKGQQKLRDGLTVTIQPAASSAPAAPAEPASRAAPAATGGGT